MAKGKKRYKYLQPNIVLLLLLSRVAMCLSRGQRLLLLLHVRVARLLLLLVGEEDPLVLDAVDLHAHHQGAIAGAAVS